MIEVWRVGSLHHRREPGKPRAEHSSRRRPSAPGGAPGGRAAGRTA
jgi:hypothetical protein